MQAKTVKIAYIGGGSRGWARTLMNDLAQQNDFTAEGFKSRALFICFSSFIAKARLPLYGPCASVI